jgi:ATP-binding cassette ChvD family protein
MSQEYVFVCHLLNKKYDDRFVLKDITLAFLPGAKIGVIGHNGAGKSTLLRIMAQEDKAFEGMARAAEDIKIGYVPQEPTLDPTLDALGNIQKAVQPIRDLLNRYNDLCEKMCEPLADDEMARVMDEQARVQDEIDAKDAWELDRKLEQAMHALHCPPGDSDVSTLSGGEKRRLALCRVLLEQPDLLLLDEPTNHLDADSVAWLEQHLKDYQGTVILITHDRYFLDNVVGWMLEIERGKATPYEGNYSTYLQKKAERLRVEERQEASRRRMLDRELEWIRQSPKARSAKSKARIKNYQQLASQERELREGSIRLLIPTGPRLGERVITFDKVSKAYGDNVLIKNMSFQLPAGGIVGVIGKNGTGKTTLLRMITGQEKPDSGEVRIGDTVQLCYVDQMRDTLDPDKTVYEEISGGQEILTLGKLEVHARAYVSQFNFRGPDQQKKLGECSGGMRNRVQLAKMLRTGGNVLLLDEPTNDLDLDTLRVLEDALDSFPGCAVIVSHDRYFLNRIATHIISFEGDGRVRSFEGDYAAYEERIEEEREEAGLGPESQAARYRKLR